MPHEGGVSCKVVFLKCKSPCISEVTLLEEFRSAFMFRSITQPAVCVTSFSLAFKMICSVYSLCRLRVRVCFKENLQR